MKFNKQSFTEQEVLTDASFKEIFEVSKKLQSQVALLHTTVTVGEESFVRSLVNGIVNSLASIVNTFKTNIFKFYKDLKRSQFRQYAESNVASYRFANNCNFVDMADILIPVPDKMSDMYTGSIYNTTWAIERMNMEEIMKAIKDHVVSITDMMKKDSISESDALTFLSKHNFTLTENASSFKEATKCFSGTTRKDAKFSMFFSPDQSLASASSAMLDAEKYFLQVGTIYDYLVDIEKGVGKIVETVQNKDVSRKLLESLANYCTSIARICDMYGILVLNLQKLENNLVLVHKKIVKELE